MAVYKSDIEKAISDELQLFAEKEYSDLLIAVMLESIEKSSHKSIPVDSMSLFDSSVAFAHYLFRHPKKALNLLDDAFQRVSLSISQNHALKADMVYRENLHARLVALPNLPEVNRSNLPACSDVGQFLCIKGTVTRVSTARMLQYKKSWRCSKCKYQFLVEADIELGYICENPSSCPNPIICYGKTFTLMSTDINTDWCKDFQEIKLQEQVHNLSVGSVPKSMTVILENDLVESCNPGSDVIVSGILIQRWKPLLKGKLIDIELVILAHNIEVQNKMTMEAVSKEMANEFGQFWHNHKDDPLKARDFILSCICPQVFGLYIVKLAVALVLAGGVQKKYGNSRIRGDSHLLLVGDPGTAKSQFLKFASKVSPRSVITSGIGTTNAGLTVSAVKESSRWQLEAGALVLADGGVCCIDEFSCIKEQDKTCIHEAMEQQTISVAKAGLVCSLNTRCSILAATNPKGAYDGNMSIAENTALGTPLLSRFDVILVLLDKNDEKWDEMVSSYILQGRNFLCSNSASHWPLLKMKNYFSIIRQIKPQVTSDAERVLQAYYTKQRSLQARSASRTTPRLLQSLIRLAEGHAKLMFRDKVLVTDAIMAIILLESSMESNSILEGVSPLLTVFPSNPKEDYKQKADIVLKNLNLNITSDDNFSHFYDELKIKNILMMISELLVSKDETFLFQSSLTGDESVCTTFEETRKFRSFGHTEGYSLASQFPPDYEVNHHKDSSNSGTKLIDIASDALKNNEIAPDKRLSPGIKTSTRRDEVSLLYEILEEDEQSEDKEFPCLNLIKRHHSSVLDSLQIYDIDAPSKDSTENHSKPIVGDAYFLTSQTQRDDASLLMELGISPEKKENVNENSLENKKIDSNLEINLRLKTQNISKTKQSLADKLMSFTLSKCKTSTQKSHSNSQILKAGIFQEVQSSSCSRIDQTKMSVNKDLQFNAGNTTDKSTLNTALQTKKPSADIENTKNVSETEIKSINIQSHCKSSELLEEKRPEQNRTNIESIQKLNSTKRDLPDKMKKFLFSKRQKTSNS